MGNDESGNSNSEKQPSFFHNAISLSGTALALVCAVNILFLVILGYFRPNPYLGIFAYMIFPAILIVGLILIPLGMAMERRHRRKLAPGEIPRLPRIDLNSPGQQRVLLSVLVFTTVFIALSAAGSYRAYEFTDSVQFCGQVCHTVMKPEYTTYLQSPHARVACVECHVGSGAGWYVRSKLSGSYQVYSVIFHKYPRPIPTPVANLRPAQQTCEQCHWPRKFYGAQLKVFYHYGDDEKNTPLQIRMLINTGGGQLNNGLPSGIHWHMNIANRISYIATDAQHQTIPWVQADDRHGHITTYISKSSPPTSAQIANTPRHLMDCIDCHDRPSHIFTPPDKSVDDALLARRIESSLPFIKLQAVTALTKSYNSTEEALPGIARDLDNFYQTKFPSTYANQRASINTAIATVQDIYQHTIFPYMKVDWRTHPNNIGHYYSAGCFRCHDGDHVSADGKVIPKDCNTCHTVLAEVRSGTALIARESGVPFEHPIDIGDLKQVACSDCHSGGVGP